MAHSYAQLLISLQYPDSIFQIWTTEGNQLVLPPRYVDELKMKQDTVLPSSLLEVPLHEHSNDLSLLTFE